VLKTHIEIKESISENIRKLFPLSAQAAAATATCTQCTDAQLPTLTLQDAINAGLNGGQPGNQALSVTRPATTTGVDAAGCNTLTPNCPQPGELVRIHIECTWISLG
jgi:hypothetical protein